MVIVLGNKDCLPKGNFQTPITRVLFFPPRQVVSSPLRPLLDPMEVNPGSLGLTAGKLPSRPAGVFNPMSKSIDDCDRSKEIARRTSGISHG